MPNTCAVTGNVRTLLNAGVQGCIVRVSVLVPFFHGASWISGEVAETATDANGDFSITVIETETVGEKLTFTFDYTDGDGRKLKKYAVVVPDDATADIADLVTISAANAQASIPASYVSVSAITGLDATNAQAALAELQADILAIDFGGITSLTGDVTATGPGASAATIANSAITDAKVSASAAITRSKTATGTAYRILANDSSGIMSENAAITASRAVVSDANGQLEASSVTATELGYVSGVTSAIQTQLGALVSDTAYDATSWNAVTTVAPSKNAVRDKFEALPGDGLEYSSGALKVKLYNEVAGVGDGLGVDSNGLYMTYDGVGLGVPTPGGSLEILDEGVTNAKLAHMAQSTIKGRAAGAGTGDATDLTATQATAILNAVVGDSGSGGTKGLVPAPAAGDAAASKFLKADGTWTVVETGGGAWGEITGTLADQTDLQAALDAKATASDLTAHIDDTSDAHDASAISFSAVGTIAATDAQAAIAEVATDAATALSTHEADTSSIHGIADTSVLALGVSSAVDSEVALFSSTGGKQLKRATGTGPAKLTSGVLSAAAIDLSGSEVTSTLPDEKGGTGQSTYAKGDLLYASASDTLSKLAIGTADQILKVSTDVPAWADLATNASAQITVDSGNGFGSTNTAVRRFSNIRVNTGAAYWTYADSATLGGSVTINAAGVYAITYHDGYNSGGVATGIMINNTVPTTAPGTAITYAQGMRAFGFSTANSNAQAVSWTGVLAAGDVITFVAGVNANSTTSMCMFTVTRVSAGASGDVTTSATQTLTNKRITERVVTLTDAATVTLNADTTDVGILTSLSQTTEFANPSGTPTNGQIIRLRIKSTSARTLTFGSQFRGSVDLALPTATSGSSLTDYYMFMYNSADTKWDYLAKNAGF